MLASSTSLTRAFKQFVSLTLDESCHNDHNPKKFIKTELLRAHLTHHFMTNRPCSCPDILSENGSLCRERNIWRRLPNNGEHCYPERIDEKMFREWKKTGHYNNRK